jgi:predicted dehydrogenase
MKVGVVGLGTMGRNHLRVWSETAGVEVVAIADPLESARIECGRGRTWATYATLDEMLARHQIDAVSIATPTSAHELGVAAAVSQGVHVLVEKPLGPDTASAERIEAMVSGSGVVAMVGHIERFNPALQELRRRVGMGEIGAVFQLLARRVGPFPPRIRDVGVVQDLATHDLDQVRHLLQSEIDMIFAQTAQRVHAAHEDLVTVIGRTAGGAIINIDVNWLTPRKVRETVVIGDGGMFVADSLLQDLFLYENNWDAGSWRILQSLRGVSEGNMVRFALRRVEPLRAELEAFAAAVRGDIAVPTPLSDGVAALRLAEATLRSARDGVPVSLATR